MPNILDESGLQTKTREELITEYTDGMKAIYGNDINLDPDSPDGQQMYLIIQMVLDELDLIREVYNSFDPDQSIGTSLDKRVSINGIQRIGGTYSVVPIAIVTSQPVTLDGYLDVGVDEAYTVEDDAGTQWVLIDTYTGDGSFTLSFRAKEVGEENATLDTIVNQVSVVLGVESVTNASILITLGNDEETDYKLKIRRQKSVSKTSSGYLAGLYAELFAVDGIDTVNIYENRTSAVDVDGSPAHSIWVIVSGVFTDSDISEAIYRKRNGGCNMRGDESFIQPQVDGNDIVINWDIVESEALHMKFTLESLDGVNAPLSSLIQSELPNIFIPEVSQKVNINDLVEAIKDIDSNSLVTLEGFNLTGSGGFFSTQEPTTKKNRLIVSTANIDITVV